MADVTIKKDRVPRAGRRGGVAGSDATVDAAVKASIEAELLRKKPGELRELQQKQRDKDRKSRGQ